MSLDGAPAGGRHHQEGTGEAAATTPAPSPPAAGIDGQAQTRDVTTAETAQTSATGVSSSLASKPAAPTVATFLDTPGQEIFYRMRTNGARVADAVVLVVSGVFMHSGSVRTGVWVAACMRYIHSRIVPSGGSYFIQTVERCGTFRYLVDGLECVGFLVSKDDLHGQEGSKGGEKEGRKGGNVAR